MTVMPPTVLDDRALVACHNVARTFGSGIRAVVAVHAATCRIEPGQTVALVGASGSGKSTLLNLMAGLDVPSKGSVSWPAIGDRSSLRPGPVGVVFQTPSLLPPLNVVENVALPLLLAGVSRAEADALARDSLARLGLGWLAGKLPEELSGGQAQRVAVARVLAGTPQLILADEPTGQLDHAAAAEVMEALLAVTELLGDETIAERLAIRWQMTDGRLQTESDTPCLR
jgi:ABC-type lipoprotein export system ATPase subunit